MEPSPCFFFSHLREKVESKKGKQGSMCVCVCCLLFPVPLFHPFRSSHPSADTSCYSLYAFIIIIIIIIITIIIIVSLTWEFLFFPSKVFYSPDIRYILIMFPFHMFYVPSKTRLSVKSAYSNLYNGEEPPFTTWKVRGDGEYCHTLDYIFHNK